MITDLNFALQLTCQLVALAVLIESAAALAFARQWRLGGVNAGSFVERRGRFHAIQRRLPPAARRFLSYPGPVVLHGVRLMAGAGLIGFAAHPEWRGGMLVVLFLTGIGQQLRGHTTSGAESHLRTMVLVLALTHLVPHSVLLREAALWFIAAHVALVYVANGWSKLAQSSWRDGSMIHDLAREPVFGHPWLEKTASSYPEMARWASAITVPMQCAFPLALVTGETSALLFVIWGISFHLLNALLFGLAPFLFSFPSAYPAVLFVSWRVASLI
jgi:hypothetical protein